MKSKSRLPTTKNPEHVYVYAAAEGRPTALPSGTMPGGAAPRVLPIGGDVSLILSDVPARLYNAALVESRLSDLDWVAEAGAAHHGVVDALADAGAVVLPFRLFTIFSSEQKAAAEFEGLLPAIRRAFDRVRGRQEWILRIGKPDPARIDPADAGRLEGSGVSRSATTGTGFLAAKAAQRRQDVERAERVKTDAAAAFQSLQTLAEAAKTRAVDPRGNVMLDAAFLVRPAQVEPMKQALTRAAARLLTDGCPVGLTGPWPPYSFASLDADADG